VLLALVIVWPLLVIWLLCGVLTAFVAQARGRDAGGWALLGIIGGVVALLVLIVLPHREEQETITCAYCAERILARAKVCRYCGRDVPAQTIDIGGPVELRHQTEREVTVTTGGVPELHTTFELGGDTKELLPRLQAVLDRAQHFRKISTNVASSEVTAEYNTLWTEGSLRLTLGSDGELTLLTATATPSGKILDAFEQACGASAER
jgi:hypothetical protein